MSIRLIYRSALIVLALLGISSPASAQSDARRLLEPASGPPPQARGNSVAATRHARARVDTQALSFDRIDLTLFDDVRVTARRTGSSHARRGSTVWHGKLEAPYRGDVTLAAVDNALAGSVTMDGRMFEIASTGNGLHEVREVNPALFPTEDLPLEPDLVSSSGSATVSRAGSSGVADGAGQIDVIVVWTPAARNAVGGTAAAIQSLVDLAVANANASYANSQVATTLRVVYSGEVNFAETPANTSLDLSRLAGTNDGYMDQIHTLRDQYGADIVSLIGSGYASAGSCGVGYLMSTVAIGFAGHAFNVVDQSCAGGYLSFAHEVGHNQGLHHDPPNAGSTPSYPYAYGFQDPFGAFRTVMSYGGAPRVQHFSNPNVAYAGSLTGTAAQDNARALNNNAATVANFRSSSAGTPTCSYTITPTSMGFTESGGTATVDVTTEAGCAWTTVTDASWVGVGPGGSGAGSVVVFVAANTGSPRSARATIAGSVVSISEAGVAAPCTYAVTPRSLTFDAGGGAVTVSVTTGAGCSWATTSSAGWTTVTPGATGSGSSTVTAIGNPGDARNTTLNVAGQTVTVTQAASTVKPPSPCTYAVTPVTLTAPAAGGVLQVQVSTAATCGWTAKSNSRWLKVTGGGTGAGPATLHVDATSGKSRTATAIVAGKTVSVTQQGGAKGR